MVPLEARYNYFNRVVDNHKLHSFYKFLWREEFKIDLKGISKEIDQVFFGILKAIDSQNKSDFQEHYAKISSRIPKSDSSSPFVNDDFLIFILIIGIVKWNISKEWIKNVLTLRRRSEITITFDNLIDDNLKSKSNNPAIVSIFLDISGQRTIDDELANFTLEKLTHSNGFELGKNDFISLVSLRSYDLICMLKTIPKGSDLNKLLTFKSRFLKRTKILSTILFNAVLVGILYFIPQLVGEANQEIKDLLNNLSVVLGIIGFGLLGGNAIPLLKKKFYHLVIWLLGFEESKNN